jgi:hypothetical protein
LKEDQAFALSLELGRREKVARHPPADFLPLPPKESSPQPVPTKCLGEGGKDFVDTIIAEKMLKKGMRDFIKAFSKEIFLP